MTLEATVAQAGVPGVVRSALQWPVNSRRSSSRCRLPRISRWSRHSQRAVLTHRSANAFAFGAGWAMDDPKAFGPEDLVERTGELGVPVSDQEPNAPRSLPNRQVPGLLGHASESGFLVTRRRCTRLDPSSMANSTDIVRRQTVSTVKNRSPQSGEVGPGGTRFTRDRSRGAGPRPSRRRAVGIHEAETRMPSFSSSPRIRI
jgi:hypothetical protein